MNNRSRANEFTISAPARAMAPAQPPVLSSLLLLAIAAGGFVYCYRNGFLLGEIAAPVLGAVGLHGLWRGGFRKTIMLALTIGGIYALGVLPPHVDSLLMSQMGKSNPILAWSGSIVLIVVGLLTAGLLVRSIRNKVIAPRPILTKLDRLGGLLVGLAEGALIILSIGWTTTSLRPGLSILSNDQRLAQESTGRAVVESFIRLADDSQHGKFGEVVRCTNPLERLPALQGVIDDFNATGQFTLDSLDPNSMDMVKGILKQLPGEASPPTSQP